MRTIRIVLGFAVACIVSLALPDRASAQDEYVKCGLCSDYRCQDGDICHAFLTHAGATFSCGSPSGCHPNFVPGQCYDNHGRCASALSAGVTRVISSLERSDLGSLRAAMAGLGDKAVLNRADGSIDVFSCGPDRTLFARLPASESTLAALAPRVPSTALRE